MKRAEALLLLTHYATMHPDDLPCDPAARDAEETPLLLCALASLSGAMDDADSWAALCEAIEHGRTLFNADIISIQQWDAEVRDICLGTLEV